MNVIRNIVGVIAVVAMYYGVIWLCWEVAWFLCGVEFSFSMIIPVLLYVIGYFASNWAWGKY